MTCNYLGSFNNSSWICILIVLQNVKDMQKTFFGKFYCTSTKLLNVLIVSLVIKTLQESYKYLTNKTFLKLFWETHRSLLGLNR